jgi:hypothetical protein
MFEARLYKIRQIQEAPIQKVDETYEIPTRPDFSLITQTVNAYPDQVGRIIKVVDPIMEGEEYFVPALACEQRDRRSKFVPQSERIVLSNLRETVVALMNVETPAQIRDVFYNNNPIPGAIWRQLQDNSYVLVNGDEIMPVNYTSDLHDDYSRMHTWLQKKIPKYVRTARLNYEEKGDKSLFVSNNQNRVKMKDRKGQNLKEYYAELKLEGNIYDL